MSLRIKIVSVFYVLTSFAFAEAQANECKHRIIFLPQSHAADELTGAQTSEVQNNEVAASQLKVASYIERFPQVPVFSEQAADQDYSWDMVPADKRAALRSTFNQIFPRGLPESPYNLTDVQKQKLVDNGGDFVQLIRGRVSVLHRVVENREDLDAIFNPIKRWFSTHPSQVVSYPPEIGSLVYGAREKAALAQIQNYFSKNTTQRDAILIYGSNHSFKFYPDQFPPECIVIPPEFQNDWNGRFRAGPEGFPSAANNTDYSKPANAVR
jgi:hypothetical protein